MRISQEKGGTSFGSVQEEPLQAGRVAEFLHDVRTAYLDAPLEALGGALRDVMSVGNLALQYVPQSIRTGAVVGSLVTVTACGGGGGGGGGGPTGTKTGSHNFNLHEYGTKGVEITGSISGETIVGNKVLFTVVPCDVPVTYTLEGNTTHEAERLGGYDFTVVGCGTFKIGFYPDGPGTKAVRDGVNELAPSFADVGGVVDAGKEPAVNVNHWKEQFKYMQTPATGFPFKKYIIKNSSEIKPEDTVVFTISEGEPGFPGNMECPGPRQGLKVFPCQIEYVRAKTQGRWNGTLDVNGCTNSGRPCTQFEKDVFAILIDCYPDGCP